MAVHASIMVSAKADGHHMSMESWCQAACVDEQVSREDCFQQGCQQAQAQGLLDSPGGACLLFPLFASQACPGDVEVESGQGPRREFFRLAGQGMLTQPSGEHLPSCVDACSCCSDITGVFRPCVVHPGSELPDLLKF